MFAMGVPASFLLVSLVNGYGGAVFALIVVVIAMSVSVLWGFAMWEIFVKDRVRRLRERAAIGAEMPSSEPKR